MSEWPCGKSLIKRKVVAIVQARMGSKRLPNKTMLWLHGLPLIGWIDHRLQKAQELDGLIFAIANAASDQALAAYLQCRGANIYVGSEKDVLGRMLKAGIESKATHVLRICADNPFTDPQEVDELVRFYFVNDYDYVYNHIPKDNCYADGLGAEMVSIETLSRIHEQAKNPMQREHALNYIWDQPSEFKVGTFNPKEIGLRHPELKLDVDTYDQYLRLLQMNLQPNMSAKEIVDCFLAYQSSNCVSSSS